MQKINDFLKNVNRLITPYKKNIIFPLLKIIAIIILCAIIVRFFTSGETLSQYADKNPDIAYQTTVE